MSKYSKLLQIYNTNKNIVWKDWLQFDTCFQKIGKQGIVGLFKVVNDKDTKIIFKISQYINYLIKHEYTIMKGLNSISAFCPHFCRSIGIISADVDAHNTRPQSGGNLQNPFEIKKKYAIEKDVLLTEYLSDCKKFYNYIKSPNIDEKILYSVTKQVLLAITIAQKEKKFTHYDLHSNNILIRQCDPDLVFTYIIDNETKIVIPTYGYYPIIIDFGFSYINDLENNYLWPSLGHTDAGFLSSMFDWVSDPKLFLVTVSYEIKEKRNSAESKIFRNIVKNIFGVLDIEMDCGWDKKDKHSFSAQILEHIKDESDLSELFTKLDNYCLDIIQTLIILPLERYDYSNIKNTYSVFLKEFRKIEHEIGNNFYNLYILKNIVDIARSIRSRYIRSGTRQASVHYFKTEVLKRIDLIAKFFRPKDIDWEILLCSLFEFAKQLEGFFFHITSKKRLSKEKEYSKLEVSSVDEIYAILETNIPDTYVYNRNTKLHIYDCINKKTVVTDISNDMIKKLNSVHNLSRGKIIYETY